jgi:nicotinamidase/pyrazinamidase
MKIFYDVDTQRDFMDADGALYVPGAEFIKPNISLLTTYARENKIPIWGSVDAHIENDPEFMVFPRHCVIGTRGQEKIIAPYNEEKIFKKAHYDVFTNLEFEKELLKYQVKEAVVYGVATDICVRAAVLGMQERGIQTYVVEDAIRGVFEDKTKIALEEMKIAGAKFVKTPQILGERK